MQSPNWVPFYDDGRIVMFGRADAPDPDLAFFKANRLDPELRAYRTAHPVPGTERPPNPTSMIDDIFQNSDLQPAAVANPIGTAVAECRIGVERPGCAGDSAADSRTGPLPAGDPGRPDRTGAQPDDWIAYRVLSEAYRYLMMQEAAMLAGIPITPENANRIRPLAPKLENLMNRFQQRVTVLNFAIQTTPPPDSPETRRELLALNLELVPALLERQRLDLARDRLQVVLDTSQPDDFAAEVRVQFKQQLDELDQQMKQVEDSARSIWRSNDRPGRSTRRSFALARGAAGPGRSRCSPTRSAATSAPRSSSRG